MMRAQRHQLLRVAPQDWPLVMGTRLARPSLGHEHVALVEEWGAAGRPVIARRSLPEDAPGAVPVGLPLPPAFGKLRVAMAVPDGVPWQPMQPVDLEEARDVVPAPWLGTVDALLALGRGLGVTPAVFGALLWQSVTGLPYLHEGSDMDLLWSVPAGDGLGVLLDELARTEAAAPMRIDGEVVTAWGAVAWRELAAARRGDCDVVLAKSIDRARFVAASDILARAAAACC
jgi:phosphoribosyl-dephospho-CoA transferase